MSAPPHSSSVDRFFVPLSLTSWCTTLMLLLVTVSPPLAATKKNKDKNDDTAKSESPLPLEADGIARRSFEITTDEVTWLSVDIDPTGSTLVMEVLGDLYTLPVEGGEATPLETLPPSMGFDSQPAWSPDGEWIAFVSDRDGAENLWIAPTSKGDGREPKQLTRDKEGALLSPTWSADGDYVIVSRAPRGFSSFELWMYHKRGGAGVQITKSDPTGSTPPPMRVNAFGATASPDGRYLYYATRRGGFQYNAGFPLWQITRRDLVTGDEDTLTSTPGSAMRPLLSNDGKTLVYATRHDADTALKLRDLDTGEERWLAYPVQRDEQESRGTRDLYPGYAFTPDDESLITTWDGKLHRVDTSTGESAPIPFSVNIKKQIGPRLHVEQRIEDGPFPARLAQGAMVSPDGAQVAFSTLARIYVANLDPGATTTTTPRPIGLTRGDLEAYQPSWSPDGRRLVFVTWSRDGGDIWVMANTGGTPTRLTETPAFYAQPAWSPDGKRIVALRGARQARVEMPAEFGGNPIPLDLVWLDVTTGPGPAHLIAPARGLGAPHFGPEADRVYVYSEEGLQSMRFDGTDRRSHLKVTGPGFYASEKPEPASDLRISPKGGWALAQVSNRFYMVALPAVGGEAPVVDISSPSVPLRRISRLGADSFGWYDGGDSVHFTVGASLFQLATGDVSFEPTEEEGDDANDEASSASKEEKAPSYPEARRTDLIVEIERHIPQGSVVLRGARIVTMSDEAGGVIERGDILIEANRIKAVGSSGSIEIPSGAREIDASGTTITPGFIDAHAHWTEIRRGVLDTEAWTFMANLAYGVTTGLDVQTMTNDMFAYQDFIDAGRILGPRAFSTGPGVFSDNDFQSLDDARAILQRYRDHYRTRNLKAYISGNRKQRQWIVQAAAELGMMPTTEGALDQKLDLTHAIDGFAGNEHAMPVVPLFDDVAQLFAASGTAYNPTLLVAYGGPWAENWFYTKEVVHDNDKLRRFVPHDVIDGVTRKRDWFRDEEHIFKRLAESAARVARAGGHVGIGAHGQLQGLGYHWELWALQSGGMSTVEALRAATIQGAEIIGLEKEIGSLVPGKLADLLVLEKNPLTDIRNSNSVRWVMKNGELFEGDTLDQIWPIEKKLPAFWWWQAEPGSASGVAPPAD